MIEAVNSVIANASLVRNVAEQSSSARLDSGSVAEERQNIAAPVAPYISPYIEVNTQFDTAVLQIRDSDTGDVLNQYPSESTLEARRRAEALREAQTASETRQTPDDSGGRQEAVSSFSFETQVVSSDTSVQVQQSSQATSSAPSC